MSTLIELHDICVDFNQRRVLDKVNLSLSRGKITTLIGPNGAGKSTLVRVLLGLHPQDSGSISRGENIKIGYVPQKLKLNDTLPLTVNRFLRLAGKYSPQEINESLLLVGAEHLNHSDMHKLSGGENQRVLLARALLQRPDVLVLDEPAQGVDVQGQIDLYDLIDAIRLRFHCAVFMVSHDLHLVMAKTDEVICLHHHICCSGSPADISQHPSYLALFGHRSRETLAFYQHNHQHHHDLAGQPVKGDAQICSHHSHGHHHHD
ncbi:zinc ABC transporter ATP-binding protein ZnuC [Vibrio cincinnatiensis]|jgi:zinc transport system ATP-binding protein|uniref:Zinc transport system ATP-binding protein n=1 Tax=Vibrio cincinnatiensis DSM 19608 TaxID=1123491 RepID=A0A1T4MCR7_VIBCI|nr:zinc ABC transporter ATP-binding protein ZnuC [Vibrio cincinnatiensis]MCG3721521.1 zinc ABC transporter ATP-binding protein ZnuC [Vibrio cincinnatiensis]MCG3725441.1 zinc ABC transporter ATP-binding protein ZnuC [Vibrio cincinnatiensis]MCG3732495.1 zinc ABC transporter ATP-binding protein ZnuC [Vibrio cincinnatiensis]MCG3736602.1 zinc ABC transporter ATP-binding protein ZnuC [Vibrio cincinnatiensis]MCG3738464.1 zinc ABC transporter ATP-binding protein ZnuC [Vibrio cincinnatiensis]